MIAWEKLCVFNSRPLLGVLALMLCGLCVPHEARAQYGGYGRGFIDAGTTILVRTSQPINSRYSNGRVYSGVVARNVISKRGSVAIPRGSAVELVVRYISRNEVTLDLDSV